MPVWMDEIWTSKPGAGLNAPPFEAEEYIDLNGVPGAITGLYYSLLFRLGKWGFERVKIEDWVEVSPVNKQYYDLTMQQKQAMEQQIKAGLASISQAISDFELVSHDLRKYKEFLDYFTWIEKGKQQVKEGKKEEGEKQVKKGEQTLKAIFIDQVDAHTGEGISLRSIAPRWPTIIADFMQLSDEDDTPEKILEKKEIKGISKPEAVVLTTKNKLYVEWRDKLFKETVRSRYQSILGLVKARDQSVKDYKNMLKPILTRYRAMTEKPSLHRSTFFRPEAQAMSSDFVRIWCWKPFSIPEKYKVTREFITEISAKEAGFRPSEIEEIKNSLDEKSANPDVELFLKKSQVYSLPIEPSIDDIVREYKPKVEKEYEVTLTPKDLFEARKRLVNQYLSHGSEVRYIETRREITPGAPWPFSPYFIFLDIPFLRVLLRFPNGTEMEDVIFENFRYYTQTQNVIIVHILEQIAREKQVENYVSQMLGEMGVNSDKLKSIEDLSISEYSEIFTPMSGKYKNLLKRHEKEIEKMSDEQKQEFIMKKIAEYDEKIKKMKEDEKRKEKMEKGFKDFKGKFGDVLKLFVGSKADWVRASGPYEFAMYDRLTKFFQIETGGTATSLVINYIKAKAGVPGITW